MKTDERSWKTRALSSHRLPACLAVFILAGIALNPYTYGVGDHAYKIPFLKAAFDPGLYPRDLTVGMSRFYVSFFDWLVFPLQKAFGFPLAFLILYCATQALFYFSIFRIATRFSGSRAAGLMAVLLLLFPREAAGGVMTFDSLLEERMVAFSLLLFGVDRMLAERYLWAGCLFGLAADIHLVSAVNAGVFIGCYFLLSAFDSAEPPDLIRRFGRFFLGAAVCAVPFFVRKLAASPQNVFALVDREWLRLILMRSPHHFLPSPPLYARHLILGAALILLLRRSGAGRLELKVYTAACLAMAAGAVLGSFFVYSFPLLAGLQMSFFRTDAVFIILSYVAAALVGFRVLGRWPAILACAAACFAFLSLDAQLLVLGGLVILLFLLKKPPVKAAPGSLGTRHALAALALFAVLVLLSGRRPEFDSPFSTPSNPNTQAQEWLRNSTDRNALVLAPPYEWDFRVYSERSTVGSWKDFTYSCLDRGFAFEMFARLQDLCAVMPGDCAGFGCLQNCRDHYVRLSGERLADAARRYGATHVVVERTNTVLPGSGLTALYQNRLYTIYQVLPAGPGTGTSAGPVGRNDPGHRP